MLGSWGIYIFILFGFLLNQKKFFQKQFQGETFRGET